MLPTAEILHEFDLTITFLLLLFALSNGKATGTALGMRWKSQTDIDTQMVNDGKMKITRITTMNLFYEFCKKKY